MLKYFNKKGYSLGRGKEWILRLGERMMVRLSRKSLKVEDRAGLWWKRREPWVRELIPEGKS